MEHNVMHMDPAKSISVSSGKIQTFVSFLIRYVLPFGWFVLLTGMFWSGGRSGYHSLYYGLVATPCLLVLIFRPALLPPLTRQPVFIAFAVFAAYIALSIAWTSNDNAALSLIKRPLYVAMFLLSGGIIIQNNVERLSQLLYLSALVAVLSAIISLVVFNHDLYFHKEAARASGYGALYNPLLTAHVYGAFTCYWMTRWVSSQGSSQVKPLTFTLIIGLLLVQTGSRTPFVGLGLALLWLLAAKGSRRVLYALAVIATLALLQYIYAVNSNIWAGFSHRPEIWIESLRQISEAPWFGHGYEAPMIIKLANLNTLHSDPHNIELGVLYDGGVVGLALWVGLFVCALRYAWKYRSDALMLIASTWLLYGVGAGLTEGRAYMSRPKEHWFLIWIPMALIFASCVIHSINDKLRSAEAGKK